MGDVISFPSRLPSSAGVDDDSAGRAERWHPSQGTPRWGSAPSTSSGTNHHVHSDVPADEITTTAGAGRDPRPRGLQALPGEQRTRANLEPLWRELVGQHLREVRHEHDLRLKDVAERAGVSPQYLSEVERGLKDPSSELLAAIAGALGLGIFELLSDVSVAPHAPSPSCLATPHLTLVV